MAPNNKTGVVTDQPRTKKSGRPQVTIKGREFEALSDVTRFVVRQLIHYDIKERCGEGNSFNVWSDTGELLFYALEESNCCFRWCCGPHRGFRLTFYDTNDDVIGQVNRVCCRCDCCFCCLDCVFCVHKARITDKHGHVIGIAKQKYSFCNPVVETKTRDDDVIAKFKGPGCPCRCCTDMEFSITDENQEKDLGIVQKHWGGDRVDDVNRDHELFDVRMTPALSGMDKFILLATSFFLHYTYFEMS